MKNKTRQRKLDHNVGTHKERMTKRRVSQRTRVPMWAVGLLAYAGLPEKTDRNEDFFKELDTGPVA